MEASFWHSKWELGQIGFHEMEANALLVEYLDKLQLNSEQANEARLFLPLCGKTLDIGYLLELGYQVIGIELSELAIKELFQELDVTPKIKKEGKFILYQAENLVIYVGDFFDLTTDILGHVDAIYDRAALIALPEETRHAYMKHLCAMTDKVQQLLVCIEYDQALMDGPPFAINEEMVQQYYQDIYRIDQLTRNEIVGGFKGKYEGYESAYLLSPNV